MGGFQEVRLDVEVAEGERGDDIKELRGGDRDDNEGTADGDEAVDDIDEVPDDVLVDCVHVRREPVDDPTDTIML